MRNTLYRLRRWLFFAELRWRARLGQIVFLAAARNRFSLTTSAEVALSAATAKTVLQLISATNVRLAVSEVTISFDGTSNTAEPVLVVVRRQTTAGTATSRTPLKLDDDISTALQTTGSENATAEPTGSDILATMEVHPQAGVIYQLPIPDGEIVIGSADRLGIVATAPAAVNCVASMRGEE